jgi:ElaB/YqjD/DUF883 family membrane-anchored ribosome-binding protein
MNHTPFATPTDTLPSRAAAAAEEAIHGSRQTALDALDGLSGAVQGLEGRANHLQQRGEQAWGQVRASAVHAGASTRQYIQAEPVKAVLMAAGAGAALMALVGLLVRASRHPR